MRRINDLLTLATDIADGDKKRTTTALLEALVAHEGDSDLGTWLRALLIAGPYYVKEYREDYEECIVAVTYMINANERLTTEYEMDADLNLERKRK